MKLTCGNVGAVRVLTAAGRIDHANAPVFQEALAPYLADCGKETSPLVLDLSGVDYISSIGLRALILADRQVSAQHGQMVIAALMPFVAEVFNISRLNMVFRIFSTTEAAIAELTP